ncbi:MAG TPA: LysR substrate-binding domain-containing protein, partial [Rhizomicrobium sp.]|nr:LysR substrate-binding domain-containing protein [Rhizomicrobium sp.]
QPERWSFGSGKTGSEVTTRSRLVLNTVEAAIDAAKAGAGITRALSYQVEPHIRQRQLRIVLASFEPPRWPVHFLYKPQARIPKKLRAFLDFAAPRLRQRLAKAGLATASARTGR